ncbi:uncharacterized protein LACBIDRAFT_303128 [Laccaria bicolor S238N-H82]|uniref:Predicted protein n=1 Tax=Laccaria bicolor (strain S238N-H82 / ATCC MYA-4686) TaxID=486041 RepID=B0DIZ7_LACBS|nr:uncharacterized protein LACBIDRAFT_303128 [Laccaria bicolor S238N-H82]EDR05431.1 predicted protein [Laccaria bicolor S238N-H82]|eukprot:XP_001883989.1 predicted protein [Laccaria bicolor S238N-H82]
MILHNLPHAIRFGYVGVIFASLTNNLLRLISSRLRLTSFRQKGDFRVLVDESKRKQAIQLYAPPSREATLSVPFPRRTLCNSAVTLYCVKS